MNIYEDIKRGLVGHDEIIRSIASHVAVGELGISDSPRPIGVFALLGPTGVGKTETVYQLARAIHGTDKKVLRIDCGEFQLEHETAKLIGAPPGYIGHRETTPMLTQIKVNGVTSEYSDSSIILFDEIEKAAPSFIRLLLAILDQGVLRLGDGGQVSFSKSYIFMTSNVGASDWVSARATPGFMKPMVNESSIYTRALKATFPPEFINRIDEVLTYGPLTKENINEIAELQLKRRKKQFQKAGHVLKYTKAAVEKIAERGYSEEWGAREVRRVIQEVIQAGAIGLSKVHKYEFKVNDDLTVSVEEIEAGEAAA